MQLLATAGLAVAGVFRPGGGHRHDQPHLSRRARVVATLAVAVLVSGLIAGVLGATVPGRSAQLAVGFTDSDGRRAAAGRADRSSRLGSGAAALVGPTPAATPTATARPAWVDPLPGAALTSCFGWRWGAMHEGVDFAQPEGVPILAAAAGIVIGAGWLYSGYGLSVLIDNGNGIFTHYAHADEVLVSAGQRVAPGQPIALEGATGDATGPHLHFEVHDGLWNRIDPAPFLRAHGVAVGC